MWLNNLSAEQKVTPSLSLECQHLQHGQLKQPTPWPDSGGTALTHSLCLQPAVRTSICRADRGLTGMGWSACRSGVCAAVPFENAPTLLQYTGAHRPAAGWLLCFHTCTSQHGAPHIEHLKAATSQAPEEQDQQCYLCIWYSVVSKCLNGGGKETWGERSRTLWTSACR